MVVKALISWSGNNYCVTNGPEVEGCIIVTDKSLDNAKRSFAEALKFHVEGMLADGDDVPLWLQNGEYEIEYSL